MKALFKNFTAVLLGFALALVGLEVVVRFLPVDSQNTQDVNQAAPYLHFEPDRVSDWSDLWDMSMSNRVRSNNYGYINDQDYTPDSDLPLVAVVGDSYVEAFMVPFAQTVQGRLAASRKGRARVYSFASSGAPLSQYLAYADFARQTFAPDRFIFVVVGNDFDESHMRYKSAPGFHYFRDTEGGELELTRVDMKISPLHKLVRSSRLALYLVKNLKLFNILNAWKTDTAYVGNTRAEADEERLTTARRATDAFLRMAPVMCGRPASDILIGVDGPRQSLYDETQNDISASFFGQMRTYLIERARRAGFQVLDMAPVFARAWNEDHKRFEFAHDNHWNGYAHGLFARQIEHTGFLDTMSAHTSPEGPNTP